MSGCTLMFIFKMIMRSSQAFFSRFGDVKSWNRFPPSPIVHNHIFWFRALQTRRIEDQATDDVRIDIWCRSSIFDIALTFIFHGLRRDTNRCCSAASTISKLVNWRCLVNTRQSLVVVFAIKLHMHHMGIFELFHHIFNIFHATRSFSHCFCRKVGVASGSIQIAKNLWFKTNCQIVAFCHSHQQISGCIKMIALFNPNTWSNLEFPLRRHHFAVGAWNFEASIEAGFVMLISYLPTKACISTNRTVIWTLLTWKSILWPLVWPGTKSVITIKQSVFLL